MFLTENDLSALIVSLKLGIITTALLLCLVTPLAWHLAKRPNPLLEALTNLPLVLPPTVLGFYLLFVFGKESWIPWHLLPGDSLNFTFTGLVVATCIASFPFALQPLKQSFEAVSSDELEAAAMLGASSRDRFFSIVFPQSLRGYLSAAALAFAHTIGEFGVVLMIGGSIPGETRVMSIALFEEVEALQFGRAHVLALLMLGISFTSLCVIASLKPKKEPSS